jgi:hypothetical protein
MATATNAASNTAEPTPDIDALPAAGISPAPPVFRAGGAVTYRFDKKKPTDG